MIVWPEEQTMKVAGSEALGRFRATSAAAELETSKASWRVVAWPWTSQLPQRVLLENDAHGAVAFTMLEGGLWTMTEEPRAMRMRSVEALDRDARGLPEVASRTNRS